MNIGLADTAIDLTQATKNYKKRGWILIHSEKFDSDFYLVKHRAMSVTDRSLPKYTPREIQKLSELDDESVRVLHDAKTIFGGQIER